MRKIMKFKNTELQDTLEYHLSYVRKKATACFFIFHSIPVLNITVLLMCLFNKSKTSSLYLVLSVIISGLLYIICRVIIAMCSSSLEIINKLQQIYKEAKLEEHDIGTLIIETDKDNITLENELNSLLGTHEIKIIDEITEKKEHIVSDEEIEHFKRMFLMHKPNEDIMLYTKEELMNFGSTHGFTINYDSTKLEKLIDGVVV